ncbi:MAG: hypothetical protein A2066_15150 [Bacteroidetes bacterium GWB2_41_8]|nr:MAG: hypothetical protein A2066_15150 [Bacteroidetes bacterium GWB2_41_8]
MKKILFILFASLMLNSCSTINKVVEVDDRNKQIKSIKLRQQPSVYLIEKNNHSSHNLTVILISETKSGIKPDVKIAFQFKSGIRSEEFDSVMYFVLDQEKIKAVSIPNSTSQLMSREFVVPENLWVSIVHSKSILYRLYIGHDGIDVELIDSEMNKVREFFNKVIQQRDTLFPPVPGGKMKW